MIASRLSIKIVLLIAILRFNTCEGQHRQYHLYRPGHRPNTCDAEEYETGRWSGRPVPLGESLIGTTYAFNLIYLQQHPHNCTARKYLLWLPSHSGIGSNIHNLGMALAHALTLDRILLIHTDNDHPFFDVKYCAPGDNPHDCYFEPITNCTVGNAAMTAGVPLSPMPQTYDKFGGLTSIQHETLPEMLYGAPEGAQANSQAQDQFEVKVLKLTGTPVQHQHIPKPFLPFLHGSVIQPNKWYYWWRAVSAAYIVRPNKRTLHAIEERRKVIYPALRTPHGTIAVHVRHGDKWKESESVDDTQYMTMAKTLYDEAQGELGLTHNIYLSTEDEETVRSFQQFTGWNVSYTHVQRFTDPELSPLNIAGRIGRANEMINSLVSLDLALQCDAFVMTLSSNWCRLIDELRATVRCKADRPFLDAQQDNTMADYDLSWRRYD